MVKPYWFKFPLLLHALCSGPCMQADRATAAVNLEARYQISPHALFELLADPNQHDKIFDAILVSSRSC
jgi:hypothetical protein